MESENAGVENNQVSISLEIASLQSMEYTLPICAMTGATTYPVHQLNLASDNQQHSVLRIFFNITRFGVWGAWGTHKQSATQSGTMTTMSHGNQVVACLMIWDNVKLITRGAGERLQVV